MQKRKAYLLDLDYTIRNGKTHVRFLVKGKKTTMLYYQSDPYFYIDAPAERIDEIKKVRAQRKNMQWATPLKIEVVEKTVQGKKKHILKVVCWEPGDVPLIKSSIPYPAYEFNIPFSRRFSMDWQLAPLCILHYEREGNIIRSFQPEITDRLPELKLLAFDIETYNPAGAPREKKDPVIMISYAGTGIKSSVLTYKKIEKDFVTLLKDEKEMVKRFSDIVLSYDPDILTGYNSSNFDLPYLSERAFANKINFSVGRWGGKLKTVKKGLSSGLRIGGRLHVDLYPAARFFQLVGVVKSRDLTLEHVYQDATAKKKQMVNRLDIWQIWDSNKLEELADYSLFDASATLELAELFLPLEIELSKVAKMPIFETALSTAGQLVENLLMYRSATDGAIIPSRPTESLIRERMASPIQGAFVKLPDPGIYDNIAVMDFRSLYPSLIVSYNIDPYSITNSITNEGHHLSPTGTKFLKTPLGLIPRVVSWLIDYRATIKKELKKTENGTTLYKQLEARSNALKILSNSMYGYLAYPRSRWYSKECGEATTAYGRKHIMETIERAEQKGFQVLYGDTDSLFIIHKNKQQVLDFITETNKSLPEKMELELEGFYPRGVFVSKKVAAKGKEATGAKKKYALLGEDGRIKIRGFELVRRDWSEIAKKTQFRVLESILKEGNKENAVAIVRETIERLNKGAVSLDELTIVTQLKKDLQSYAITSPELGAATKAKNLGVPIQKGSTISYVITKTGKSISDRAQPVESVKDIKNFDANYYINNQVLPAVMKILKELGYGEEDLKRGGKQKSLADW